MYVPSSPAKGTPADAADRPLLHAFSSVSYVEVCLVRVFYTHVFLRDYHMCLKMSHFLPLSSFRIFYDSGFGYVQFGVEVTERYGNS